MDSILQTVGTTVLEYHNHKIIIAEWSLVGPILKKWSRNREADSLRVQEIANHVCEGEFVPPVLHVADLKEEGLVCYDGNHRRAAFMQVSLPTGFKVVLDVLCNATQRSTFECFENLNKCVQVPAIYVDDSDESHSVKEDILCVVQRFEKEYKPFLSTSNRPNAPNFNRDNFVDELYNFWKHHHGTFSVAEIELGLRDLNSLYTNKKIDPHTSKMKSSVLKKCQQYKFWLFKERHLNTDQLKQVLQSKESTNRTLLSGLAHYLRTAG